MLGPTLDARFAGRESELIEGWWSRTVGGPAQVVPDGAVDVLWTQDRGAWLAGPDTAPRTALLPAGSRVVGLRLGAGVATALLGSGVDDVADMTVPLDDVLPAATTWRLGATLADAPTPDRVAATLAATIRSHVGPDWEADPLVLHAVGRIRAGLRIDDLGLGERQLRRRFTTAIGYGPALYRRIARLDRFSDHVDRRPDRSLAELAARSGYFDEAHLWRDCVALTGRTPAAWRASR